MELREVDSGSDSRRGFTLVELLVVVGIITVLIAILMPALSKAREHANRVKCAANLRSVGQALVMYTHQYRYYPACEIDGYAIAGAVWVPRLRAFTGGSKDVFLCPSRDDSFRWSDAGPEPVVPAFGVFLELGYEPGEPLVNGNAHFSYAYNYNGTTSSGPAGQLGLGGSPTVSFIDNRDFAELPAGKVRRADDMIAVMDSDGDGCFDFRVDPWRRRDRVQPGTVHSGGANVLFCDGHVTWYLQQDLLIGDPDTAADSPKIRMWNNDHRDFHRDP
jgi:prepilin-type processing-associated H-X9-DG protein/prepilin-type N-terminal cleavage/methylation domain-containing protein